MSVKKNKFFSKFKKLTTTSDIDEEKKKRLKSLSSQTETTAKELSNIVSGNIGDEEYQYFMKLGSNK